MRPDSDFDVVFPGATELAAIDEVEPYTPNTECVSTFIRSGLLDPDS
jgi:hypothetical protein